MTNSEAIAVLMEQKRYVHENSVSDQALDMGIKALKNERKKGKWIKRSVSLYRCSECGRFHPAQENFCPSCGVEMEKNDEV